MNNPAYKASYFEQRFRNRIYEAIVRALEEEAAKQNLKRKDLAELIGKKESQISRWLSGPGNWTLDTVSDLLYSIGAELDFKVTRFSDKAKRNEFHPLNAVTELRLPSLPKTAYGIAYLKPQPVKLTTSG